MSFFGPPNIDKLKAKGDSQGLLKALGYKKDVQIRAASARALGQIGGSGAIEPLISALRDTDPQMRSAVTDALSQIGEPARIALTGALQQGDGIMRTGAVHALGVMKDGQAIDLVTGALEDNDHSVRKAAVQALGRIGDSRAVESLIPMMASKLMPLRQATAKSLGEIGDPRAVESLVTALQDENVLLRKIAEVALARIAPQQILESVPHVTHYAFSLEGPPDQAKMAAMNVPGVPAKDIERFRQITITAAENLLVTIMREDAEKEGAELVIIPPEVWTPLKVKSLAGPDLVAQVLSVGYLIHQCMSELGLPNISVNDIFATSGFPNNPAIGKGFVVVKTHRDEVQQPGQTPPTASTTPEAIKKIQKPIMAVEKKGKVALYAYVIQGPINEVLQNAASVMILTSSDEEVIEKIRGQAKSPDAEVIIVSPQDWDPPKLETVSEEAVNAKAVQITSRIQVHMATAHLPRMEANEIIAQSFYLVKPMSGKVFFVVKVRAPVKAKTKAKKTVPQPSDNPMALYGEMSSGLDKHIARLRAYFREQGHSGEITKLLDELSSDPFLSFARTTFSKLAERVLEENTIHSDTDALGGWFTAVTVCPWLDPVEVQAHLPGGYLALFDQLTKPFQGGKHIAHWIICTDGVGAGVHLTVIPNPNTSRGVVPVIAVDLLNSDERVALKL